MAFVFCLFFVISKLNVQLVFSRRLKLNFCYFACLACPVTATVQSGSQVRGECVFCRLQYYKVARLPVSLRKSALKNKMKCQKKASSPATRFAWLRVLKIKSVFNIYGICRIFYAPREPNGHILTAVFYYYSKSCTALITASSPNCKCPRTRPSALAPSVHLKKPQL